MDSLFCPHCGSSSLHAHKKGYNGTSGFLGAVTFGVLGAFAGTHGSNNIEITCLACGKKHMPGQLLRARPTKDQIEKHRNRPVSIFLIIWMIIVFSGVIWLFKSCHLL